MLKEPVIVAPSRVRCARCNRFVFRGSVCRCQKMTKPYDPFFNGTLGIPSARRPHEDAPDYLTAQPRWPENVDGNTSSIGVIKGAE